ncbi:hypothetical protein [Photobacterium galatheae]|uniref:Uncharacterized protein n=1 Tax=Photobacterium galatheae TaxID=1654360 RepID=A0A066S0S4_9GAMM|nr:hypothetical protein [Photobacterium galatheae]KDM93562.1 hypothetical protein EA58_00310 [Photobacterium galatheae]MCM0151385.1 hypothetical protein [Photobacterium galatheae]
MEKQYFDFLELEGEYIWAVDNESGRKAPLNITCTAYTLSSSEDIELEVQQASGGWWYLRKKFKTENEVKKYIADIDKMLNELDNRKWA